MKRIYLVETINKKNETMFTNYCKNVREVKNVIASFGGKYNYKTVKNGKLIKRLTSKSALEIIKNF